MNLTRHVIFGTVQGDQHVAAKLAESLQAARSLQFRHHLGEDWMEVVRVDRAIQGIWLSNPHSAAVMSRGFVQCASFRQPQSPARRADGLLSDGRGPGLAERTLSFTRLAMLPF